MTRRPDVLPEHAQYRDTGCEHSPTCLTCPLPQCKYDNPYAMIRERAAQRDTAIAEAKRANPSITYRALGRMFGVSDRTAHRAVEVYGNSNTSTD